MTSKGSDQTACIGNLMLRLNYQRYVITLFSVMFSKLVTLYLYFQTSCNHEKQFSVKW